MSTKTNVVEVLNKQVANWNVLYVKLHNYHWYVTGHTSLHYMRNLKSFTMKLERILMN